jgi:hypothetical protein
MTFLLLVANEFFVRHPPSGQPGIGTSLLEHLDDHSQGGGLAIAIVLTQQVPGRVLLQDRPDEIVPKTSVETLASCQAVDTVKDFGATLCTACGAH